MDLNFAIIMYNTIREFQARFGNKDAKAFTEDESLFYTQHLKTATVHAKLLEQALTQKLTTEMEPQ